MILSVPDRCLSLYFINDILSKDFVFFSIERTSGCQLALFVFILIQMPEWFIRVYRNQLTSW